MEMDDRQHAEHIGLDVQYVRRLIRQGIIPALVLPNGHFKIDEAGADAALEAYMRQPKPLPEKGKKVFDEIGTTANAAVSGGFMAALKDLARGRKA